MKNLGSVFNAILLAKLVVKKIINFVFIFNFFDK
jgi:hypothetical protein